MHLLKSRIASIGMAVIFIAIITAFIYNLFLKRQFNKIEAAPYLWKAEELYNHAKKVHQDTKIILNEEKGVWQIEGNRKVTIKCELTMSEADGDPHKSFYRASTIADRDGNIYVGQSADGTITVFNKSGEYLRTIGSKGKGPGEFLPFFTACTNNANELFVLDYGNQRLSKFSVEGAFINSVPVSSIKRPLSFRIAPDNSIYVSFFDRSIDKIIHKYNTQREISQSFGDPWVFLRPVKLRDESLRRNFSSGDICIQDTFLYFTRRNPYEICKYSLSGKLIMQIFRKNSFMPPATVEILEKGYKYTVPVLSSAIGIWKSYIINCVYLPQTSENTKGWIVDIFDLNGALLTSIMRSENFYASFIDNTGKIYGSEAGDTVKVFSIHFTD